MLFQTPKHRRIALVIVGVCAIGAVGLFAFRQDNSAQSAHSTTTGKDAGTGSEAALSSTQVANRDLDPQALNFLQQPQSEFTTPDGEVLPYPPSALEKMEERNRERGYFATEELADFEEYPRDMLESSAEEGNLLANLALRLKLDSDEVAKTKELCELAIVYGSTEAISCMATIASTELPADTPDAGLQSVLLAQAWYEVGIMRGDRLHERNAWEHLQDSFDRQVLTESERKMVTDAAQGLYDELSAKRQALGLPEFDNSIPEDVNHYYDHVIRDWLKNYLNIGV